MKKALSILLAVVLLCSILLTGCNEDTKTEQTETTSTEEETGFTATEGLEYNLNDDDTYSVSVGTAKSIENIIIPETYNGKPVTTLLYKAFKDAKMKSITIPDSIKNLRGFAFSGCTNLTSITIPANVTSIGANAFSGCASLTSITIPANVTSIGANAFKDCDMLTKVTFVNASGWVAQNSRIFVELLADPSVAAQYIKYTYPGSWVRK
ncbi:MAG: leucine-rich repeat domain-containing protein [Clostridia bacterium]|nr:leucine-rich repeat domain-containing protein [Clostridia bacterium]